MARIFIAAAAVACWCAMARAGTGTGIGTGMWRGMPACMGSMGTLAGMPGAIMKRWGTMPGCIMSGADGRTAMGADGMISGTAAGNGSTPADAPTDG